MISGPPAPTDFEVQTRPRVSRRFKIFRRDYFEHGFTLGCPGCDAVRSNRPAVNHNEECRARMEICLGSVGDPRVQRVLEEAQREQESEEIPAEEDDNLPEDEDTGMSVTGEEVDEVMSLGLGRAVYSLTGSKGIAAKVCRWDKQVDNVEPGISVGSTDSVKSSGLKLLPGMVFDLNSVDEEDGLV